eukprot:TRINITY_DN4345_c0_g1_i5.p2 TRINITY_DN4345_c0_g1~~TRINITY_DN4345_c0_g1_i5.p2  ORF type:complete len:357 (+),score=76.32 TRINITY_DN4345_c0_g1_i5:517-1587(+)
MDDTLIKTKSGKKFPTGRSDWQWLYSCVPDKLRELSKEGKRLVIFTNQGGICGKSGYDTTKERMITGKIDDIAAELGVPIQALIATTDDLYRKPATDMWDAFVAKLNNGTVPVLGQCAFIGDAAGRGDNWNGNGVKHDFSCSDRKFAHNVGVTFHTPEEFFLDQKPAKFDWGSVDLSTISSDSGDVCDGGIESLTSDKQELVVIVGFPASGKSTFSRTYMVPKGYVHVNRDTLKTPAKCLKTTEEALESGKSVVIDNTNPDKAGRASYIDLAKERDIPVRCFRMDVSEQLANHLNYFREKITSGNSPHVPRMGYAMYKKRFQEPSLDEGFAEIKHVQFVANNFAKPEHKLVFHHLH